MDFYYQSENKDFNLILGDTMETLNHIGQKVDMIFADPPYFLSQGRTRCINGTWKSFEKGEWDRATSLDNINAFNMKWLSKCRDVLKDSGTIFVSGTYHNIFSVATCMVELGYKILNIIVWQKSDAKPTLSRNYFNFTAEYIVWARSSSTAERACPTCGVYHFFRLGRCGWESTPRKNPCVCFIALFSLRHATESWFSTHLQGAVPRASPPTCLAEDSSA